MLVFGILEDEAVEELALHLPQNEVIVTLGLQEPGDHTGQLTTGYRWPYGPVAVIAPFNFPLEIPTL